MESHQQVIGWEGEFHIIRWKESSTQSSGFDRFEAEFAKLDTFISDILKNIQSALPSGYAFDAVSTKWHDHMRRVRRLSTDFNYIRKKINGLRSSTNSRSSNKLLHVLVDVANNLSAVDFPLDSTNLNQLLQIVVKLKILIPANHPRKHYPNHCFQMHIDTVETKLWVTRSMNSESIDIVNDLLISYRSLNDIQKYCLLCFSVFPCDGGRDENTGVLKGLVVKKRILINWWVGEGFIDPRCEKMTAPTGPTSSTEGVEKPSTIADIGSQVLKVLKEKGFIEPGMKNGRESTSICIKPSVHSFLTERAAEEGFFDFSQKNVKVTPRFTRSHRACLLTSQHNFSSTSYNLWADYTHFPTRLKSFKVVRTLFNVNESVIDINGEWFSRMKNLYALHLGSRSSKDLDVIEVADHNCFKHMKNMKQLRLVSLQGLSPITKLPDLICKLINLRILDLRACTSLEELPADIGSLKNLIHLCWIVDPC